MEIGGSELSKLL